MDHERRNLRDGFIPIALYEHHSFCDPTRTVCDIADCLADVWVNVSAGAQSNPLRIDIDSVLEINTKIAEALDREPPSFQNEDGWRVFIGEFNNIGVDISNLDPEDSSHVLSWVFSHLYWHHLTALRLSTAWMFTNVLRMQLGLPENRLTTDKLGAFLDSLSGSGPPTEDGQTFIPDDPYYSSQ